MSVWKAIRNRAWTLGLITIAGLCMMLAVFMVDDPRIAVALGAVYAGMAMGALLGLVVVDDMASQGIRDLSARHSRQVADIFAEYDDLARVMRRLKDELDALRPSDRVH